MPVADHDASGRNAKTTPAETENGRFGSPLGTDEVMSGLFKLARGAPFAIAPERAEELARQVFGGPAWTFRPSDTEANFWAVVDDRAIYLPHAGLASLWCVSRAAFAVSDIASRVARDEAAREFHEIDLHETWTTLRLDRHVSFASRLMTQDLAWPEDLERPDARADTASWEGRLNNLFLGALSWILLHEVGHVHHRHERLVPSDHRRRQEFQADSFATGWILDQAGSGLQREFRVLMIVVACAWLFLHERTRGRSGTHPAMILRFREAVEAFGLGERSPALENATYLLKALFDPASTDMPVGMTPGQAFRWMATRMEELFAA